MWVLWVAGHRHANSVVVVASVVRVWTASSKALLCARTSIKLSLAPTVAVARYLATTGRSVCTKVCEAATHRPPALSTLFFAPSCRAAMQATRSSPLVPHCLHSVVHFLNGDLPGGFPRGGFPLDSSSLVTQLTVLYGVSSV